MNKQVTGKYDAIIVGSGATGSWAAKILTESGLLVALVEAGPEILFESISSSLSQREIDERPVQALCGAFRGQARKLFVNDLENPFRTPPDAPFNWFRGRQVGGRLGVWSRHVPRISDIGFLPGNDTDARSWPLCYAELSPHYTAVERRLGVYGRSEGFPETPDGHFLDECLSLPELTTEVLASLRNHGGLHATTARNTQYNRGFIPIALSDALATHRVDLISNTVAIKIIDEVSGRKAKGILVVDRFSRERREIRADVVVLAASAFESVRLLLNSISDQYPMGIGAMNTGDILGRYISDHVFCRVSGTLTPLQARAAVMPYTMDDWDFAESALYISGIESQNSSFEGRYGVQINIGSRGMPTWSAVAFGEMTPNVRNHLKLEKSLVDAWGVPALHIECRHGDNERAMANDMQRRMSKIMYSVGLRQSTSVERDAARFADFGAFWPGAAIHEVGGARMGTSPRNSVVNSFCQCWECRNVFVIDGACFPYLPFQNPTLTMMALADRASKFIVKNYSSLVI